MLNLALVLAIATAATQASALSFKPLRSLGNSPFCLDVAGANIPSEGNPQDVILWHCNGQANQGWGYDSRAKALKSQMSDNFCLDISNGVKLAVCDGSEGQKIVTNDNRIQAASGNMCLVTQARMQSGGADNGKMLSETLLLADCGVNYTPWY